jgi:glutamyl-tRNA reductase
MQVSGRTPGRAADLAAAVGASPVPWSDVRSTLTDVRGVVVATAAAEPVLTTVPERVTSLVVVDPGFPAQVGDVARDGVTVVPLQSLTVAADEADRLRRAAVPEVEALIDREIAAWHVARREQPLEHAIRALHQHLQDLDLDPESARKVRTVVHAHVERLRALGSEQVKV